MAIAHKWHPITDLPEDREALTQGELAPLRRIWQKQKEELIDPVALEEFDKRLRREWAIETGIIENVYTLDRGVTRTLIEKGIDAALIPHGTTDRDSTVVARIIQDHYETLEGLFDFIGGTRQLSTGYIKEVHAALLSNQDTYAVVDQFGKAFEKKLEKGQYKTEPNSPTRPDGSIHEYCPPEQIASEMDRLVAWHTEHEMRSVAPEIEAAWLHHRFTQIHPFADGNGRVARAIATLVFIKAGWFPLIVKREDWARYVEALEKADAGDLRPLVGMFVEAQRNALIDATEAAYEVTPPASAKDAVAAVRDRLLQRGRPLKEWQRAKDTADKLVPSASKRFHEIAGELGNKIGSLAGNFAFAPSIHRDLDAVRTRAVQSVQFADFEAYRDAVRLTLKAERDDQLVLSFHGIGPRFRGFIGVVAYLAISGQEPEVLKGGTFQINYEEELENAQKRFSNWLERMIVEGLNKWRESL